MKNNAPTVSNKFIKDMREFECCKPFHCPQNYIAKKKTYLFPFHSTKFHKKKPCQKSRKFRSTLKSNRIRGKMTHTRCAEQYGKSFQSSLGRTVVHATKCSQALCRCPRHLAAGTVDSLLGKLRSIFNGLGRLGLTNPVSHPRVKEYLKFVQEEQAGLAVSSSQAAKFRKLVAFLREKLTNSKSLSRIRKYVLVRDAVFFVVDFFMGDKASDLGCLLANQVFKLKDSEGYLLRFTLTKTLRKDPPHSFALIPFCESEVCPVNLIFNITFLCDLFNVHLPPGFFFRASDRNKYVSSRPFASSAVNNRLRGYLVEAKLFDG